MISEGGGSGALQMNAPAIIAVRVKMCVLCVGERGRSPGGSGGRACESIRLRSLPGSRESGSASEGVERGRGGRTGRR